MTVKENETDSKPTVTVVDLEDLLFKSKTLQDTFTIGKHKILVRTLTGAERKEVWDRPIVRSASGILDKMEFSKIPVLARVIVSIDETPWMARDEIKRILDKNPSRKLEDAIEEFLGSLSNETLNMLYGLYLRVMSKERQAIDLLKKDLPTLPSETGGESAGVSGIDLMTRLF
jgi:hypothetical protein